MKDYVSASSEEEQRAFHAARVVIFRPLRSARGVVMEARQRLSMLAP